LSAGYSCVVEVTDEEQRDQEVMALLSPETTPEIIRPIRGFVDGIVLMVESTGSFSAISFSRSRAVHFWTSTSEGGSLGQN
jgi:hypothetical protein